jgi:hypothetical protein
MSDESLGKLVYQIEADNAKLKRGLDDSKRMVSDFGASIKGMIMEFGALFAAGLTFEKIIKDTARCEEALVRLKATLAAVGANMNTAMAGFKEFSSRMAASLGLIQAESAELYTFGLQMGFPADKIKNLAENAAILSKMLGIDLRTAMRQLVDESEGVTARMLSRQIPAMATATTQAGRLKAIYDFLKIGQAQMGAFQDTLTGKWAQFQAATTSLSVTIGNLFLPILKVGVDIMKEMTIGTEEGIGRFGGLKAAMEQVAMTIKEVAERIKDWDITWEEAKVKWTEFSGWITNNAGVFKENMSRIFEWLEKNLPIMWANTWTKLKEATVEGVTQIFGTTAEWKQKMLLQLDPTTWFKVKKGGLWDRMFGGGQEELIHNMADVNRLRGTNLPENPGGKGIMKGTTGLKLLSTKAGSGNLVHDFMARFKLVALEEQHKQREQDRAKAAKSAKDANAPQAHKVPLVHKNRGGGGAGGLEHVFEGWKRMQSEALGGSREHKESMGQMKMMNTHLSHIAHHAGKQTKAIHKVAKAGALKS